MYFKALLVAAVISSVSAIGFLSVVTYPKSLSFKENDHLKQSALSDVFSTALGFSISQSQDNSNEWRSMYIIDPFHLPEAIATVFVEGVSKEALESSTNNDHLFPLSNDEHEKDTWQELISRVQQRYPSSTSILARIELGSGIDAVKDIDNFKKIKSEEMQEVKYLNSEIPDDNRFLKDIAVLNSIATHIKEGKPLKPDGNPDVFWIVLSSLHSVHDLHGANSSEAKEANELLMAAVENLSQAFSKAYNGNALVTLATSDVAHTRRFARAAETPKEDEQKPNDMKNLNLAPKYHQDYPVIFNIILWFSVAMFFALLAISLVIGNMDPGRDSIIYRMTSNRMKKDN